MMFSNKVIIGEADSPTRADLNSNSTMSVDPVSLKNVNISIKDYVDWTFWIIFLSSALIFQHFLKVVFNIWSNLNIGIDKWTILDTLSASLNIFAIIII